MESNTFSITPMSQSFSLYPGKSYKGSIKIVNYNDSKDDSAEELKEQLMKDKNRGMDFFTNEHVK